MCGIVGYIGQNSALNVLLSGLERLEYRGYDSAGVALLLEEGIQISRAVGRLTALRGQVAGNEAYQGACVGIGHTRWATHGGPIEINAHPHRSEELALVHNGIIENYQVLREELEGQGYKFSSETDTEVAAHLLHKFLSESDSAEVALAHLEQKVEGSYAFLALSENNPERLLVARRASPLVIGVSDEGNYIASDVTALLEYTRKVIYLEDGDSAIVTADSLQIFHAGQEVERDIHEITWDLEQAQRGGYEHYMLKEIEEQPKSVNDTLSGRLVSSHKDFRLMELRDLHDQIKSLKRVKLVACGTAWHACLLGKYYLENVAGIPADVEIASEFRYQKPLLDSQDLFICVSQSGETADTLAALDVAKKYCPAVGITNVLGSTLTRKVDACLLTQAGPEISVASTKAFVTQVLVLYLTALKFAFLRNTISAEKLEWHLEQITHLSSLIHQVLDEQDKIKALAEQYTDCTNYFFLGRGVSYPVALEGALKLKEISYLEAQGYPAGELKHGPIALIDEKVLTVAILQNEEPFFSKTLSNLNEVKSRSGMILGVSDRQDSAELRGVCDNIIQVPHQNQFISPILTTIPLQIFAYHVANTLGREIDFPRNLAKSVTVE